MIRFVKVTGNIATPLPDRLADQATHEIQCTEEQYNKAVNSDYFVVENGEPRHPTTQEESDRAAAQTEAAEVSRINALRNACLSYQSQQFRCDSNFYGLLMAGKAAGSAGVKTLACLTALDFLWSLYEAMKNDAELDEDFTPAGVIPHSFDEIRAEIEGV